MQLNLVTQVAGCGGRVSAERERNLLEGEKFTIESENTKREKSAEIQTGKA
jgi:hypothetical protein